MVNHRLVTVLRASGEVQARWQELRVGDVVKVRWQLLPEKSSSQPL